MSNQRSLRLGRSEMNVLLRWWRAMSGENAPGSLRADRAALRRAASIEAVVLTPAYQRVFADMAAAHEGPHWLDHEKDRIAVIVALASHVRDAEGPPLPEAMSKRAEGIDRNPVSALRFRRLLDSPDADSLFVGLRRALPLIGHAVDLESLAGDVFAWGDAIKRRWAYAYDWRKAAEA